MQNWKGHGPQPINVKINSSSVLSISLNVFLLFKPFENISDYDEKSGAFLRGNYKNMKLTTKLVFLVIFFKSY